ncbi:hypothetical protein HPP92_026641 [Vanilla planifolia]|uniref:Dof zinc finger protein n=1 Tax=Vanilla planifolia TaxID=51239 RepID=A0A835PFX7_VANPL|nr:hypothetical protein HPP92_026641 [Vanilla planifolia]
MSNTLAVGEGETAQPRRERCPRCTSRDTKFCYFNNYNTSQPRHFCRACRRYWTLGGALRNVPVGGLTRKRSRPNPIDVSSTARFLPLPPPVSASSPLSCIPTTVEVEMPTGFPPVLGETIFDRPVGFGVGWPMGSLLEIVGGMGDSWRMDGGGGECFVSTATAAATWIDFGIPAPAEGGVGDLGVQQRKVQ